MGLLVIQIFGVWVLSVAILLLCNALARRKPNGWDAAETDHDC